MHRVAEGDFMAAAPAPTRDAEIASLTASFTQMRDRLKDTMISLELAVDNLHDKQEQLVEVEKLASLGRVAAGVAHEINNPLAVINEKAGLLQDFLAVSGEFKHRERFGALLEGITDSVKRCRTITHRLLGFARRVEVTVEPLDLNDVVRRVREYLEADRAEKGVAIELVLAEGLPTVHTDRVEFEQVLINIVKNAIDAVPAKGDDRRHDARQEPALAAGRDRRQRPGHPGRTAQAPLRTVLHDQGEGQGDRPRPLRVARDHEEARRPHPRRERRRRGDEFHAGAAGAPRRPGDLR